MRSRDFSTSAVHALLTLALTLALGASVAPRAEAQCTCDRVIPCGLQISRKWLNENGQDRTGAVGPGVSGSNSHANQFDISGGAFITHVCFAPRRSGDTVRIHLSSDLGGQPRHRFAAAKARSR